MNVISASRRTDIPAFYVRWLMNRLRAGFACYPNPYSGEVYTVSLQPEDVHSIVFWSKNYAPLLPHLDELTEYGYRFYFHYTITGNRPLEPYVPDWHQSVPLFRELAEHTSPRHVQWRFDPILFTTELRAGFYIDRFYEIATALSEVTERCYFSFAAFYGKVKRRLQEAGVHYYDPPLEEKHSLVQEMADIASGCGITLYACCEDAIVGGRIQKAHCVDGDLLADLFPERPKVSMLRPTREQCGCAVSRDIGMYDSCPYGCVYCYANQSRPVALKRFRAHTPKGEHLIQ
jgi:DNA repair photolyase